MTDVVIKAIVSGKVQGVWYRDSTRQQAKRLGVDGHAINLSNGNVEVIASGSSDKVEKLIAWLHQGPPNAVVEDVTIEKVTLPVPPGFTIG